VNSVVKAIKVRTNENRGRRIPMSNSSTAPVNIVIGAIIAPGRD
jgi:hypothetical protein